MPGRRQCARSAGSVRLDAEGSVLLRPDEGTGLNLFKISRRQRCRLAAIRIKIPRPTTIIRIESNGASLMVSASRARLSVSSWAIRAPGAGIYLSGFGCSLLSRHFRGLPKRAGHRFESSTVQSLISGVHSRQQHPSGRCMESVIPATRPCEDRLQASLYPPIAATADRS